MTGVRLRNGTVETFMKSDNELLPRRELELQSTKSNYPDRAYPNRGANFVPWRRTWCRDPTFSCHPFFFHLFPLFFAQRPERIFYVTASESGVIDNVFFTLFSFIFSDAAPINMKFYCLGKIIARDSLSFQEFCIHHRLYKNQTNNTATLYFLKKIPLYSFVYQNNIKPSINVTQLS